jgi:hypothetical protein
MATNDATLLNRTLDNGSLNFSKNGRPSPVPRAAKPGRHKHATTRDEKTDGFYTKFLGYLRAFFDKVQILKAQKAAAIAAGRVNASFKQVFFYRHNSLCIDSTASAEEQSKVWLGLGKEETIHSAGVAICKPVAIKTPRRSNMDPDILARVMAQMKPGSFIASAHEMPVYVHGLPEGRRLEDESPGSCGALSPVAAPDNAALPSQLYWVSEAGICTLHELFGCVDAQERSTQSHRRLVKEVRWCFTCCLFR